MIGLLMNKSQYYKEKQVFLVLDDVQYSRIFAIHSRINPFYSRNFIFVTQEIKNTLLMKFEGPYALYDIFPLISQMLRLLLWSRVTPLSLT